MTTRMIAEESPFLLLFVLAWLGADWATRFQYGVMILIDPPCPGFLLLGRVHPVGSGPLLSENWAGCRFRIFPSGCCSPYSFPAVTGFHPGGQHVRGSEGFRERVFPLGTFMAVGVSIVVYFGVASSVCGGLAPRNVLAGDYGAMSKVARFCLSHRRGRHRGDPFFGHGLLSGGPPDPPIPVRRPYFSLPPVLFQRVRPRKQSPSRCAVKRGHCFSHRCTGESERYRSGGEHVFPHQLRLVELCHVF